MTTYKLKSNIKLKPGIKLRQVNLDDRKPTDPKLYPVKKKYYSRIKKTTNKV